jgi:UDP-N-acetyl-D-mannosaminuronic acid dehydrogenase
VLPGKILYELENNNRIIGGITNECSKHAEEVYKVFVKGELLLTEAKVAELSKCMENTFRDVNISLANELAKICYELDINCLDVIALANKHPRVNIHQPGPGVGGHCLAIDPYFICAKAPQTAKLISLARSINKSMPDFVVDKVKMILKDQDEAKIAVFGVTYKGNIDDIRESPAIEIVTMLEESYKVAVYDPHVKNPNYVSLLEAVTDADMILLLADHNEFKNLDYKQIAKVMKQPILFDTKNMISTQEEYGLEIINYGNLYQHKNTQ